MKFSLFSLIFFFYTTISFSQNLSVTKLVDTVSTNQINYSVSLSSDFSSYKEIQIQLYQTIGGDSLIVFESTYSWLENDPSSFKSFKINEENNSILFGLGLFDNEVYFAKINIIKQDETIETITVN